MLKEKKYFDDEAILEQSIALIRNRKGKLTNGISLLIHTDEDTEVVLEREQIKKLLKDLDEDWEYHQTVAQST